MSVRDARGNAPFLLPPLGPLEHALEIIMLAFLLLNLLVIAVSYGSLPENVPVHFGAGGQPQRWGERYELWIMFGVIAVICGMLWAAARWLHTLPQKQGADPVRIGRQMLAVRWLVLWLNAELAALFAWATWGTIRAGTGAIQRFPELPFFVLLALIGITIVVYIAAAVRAAFVR
jgi:uncharacterized membrane protein